MRKLVTASGGARGQRIVAAVAVLLMGVIAVALAVPADAHGAPTRPGSRTYLCRIDGTHATGDIHPSNPACAEAVAIGGRQPLWDWFGVLRADGAGRTRGYIPDGQLCSGGEPKYAGYDLARADWPYTSLTAGAELTFRYNAWAAHPGEFRLYITRDGYDPTQPLGWDDLEPEPFSVYSQNSPNGQDSANNTPDYQWPVTLPQKSGPHIIYSVWERSDSQETFYGCSDVRFDGGSGEVVGVGPGANVVGPPTAAETTATTAAPQPDSSTTTYGDQGTADGRAIPAAEGSVPEPGTEAMTDGGPDAGEGAATAPDGSLAGAAGATAATIPPGGPLDDGQLTTGQPGDGQAVVSADQADSGASAPAPAASPAGAVTTPAAAAVPANGSGGGVSLPVALAIGLVGAALGVACTIAVQATRRNRELQDRLARYDRARPQPDWDRLAAERAETGTTDDTGEFLTIGSPGR